MVSIELDHPWGGDSRRGGVSVRRKVCPHLDHVRADLLVGVRVRGLHPHRLPHDEELVAVIAPLAVGEEVEADVAAEYPQDQFDRAQPRSVEEIGEGRRADVMVAVLINWVGGDNSIEIFVA